MNAPARFALLAFAWLLAASVQGEEPKPSGSVAITVSDRNGGQVKDAAVKAVRIGDGKLQEIRTGADGSCKLELEVGTWCFTVRAAGFGPDFTGGVVVRAKTEAPLQFMLYPGNPDLKLPFEKTAAERQAERAAAEEKKAAADPAAAAHATLKAAYEGLDAACKTLDIQRANGGPALRVGLVKQALELAANRKYGAAIEKYRAALGEDASDPLSWFNLGVLYGAVSQARQSEHCFRTAIGLCGGGGEADYHAYLGRALGTQGKFDEAEKCFAMAIKLAPSCEGQYWYEFACAYHALRMFDKAAPLFAKAIEKRCDDPAVYFAYANALEMQGHKAEALKQYKTFLNWSADDPDLQSYVQKAKAKVETLGAQTGGDK